MSEITSIKKRNDGKFVAEVLMEEQEHLNLSGHTRDIFVFSDQVSFVDANISQRGKNGATKYFLIPRQLRKGLDFDAKVSCQKLDCGQKVLFTYVIDKIARKK